jgi:hypothetical protein
VGEAVEAEEAEDIILQLGSQLRLRALLQLEDPSQRYQLGKIPIDDREAPGYPFFFPTIISNNLGNHYTLSFQTAYTNHGSQITILGCSLNFILYFHLPQADNNASFSC